MHIDLSVYHNDYISRNSLTYLSSITRMNYVVYLGTNICVLLLKNRRIEKFNK